MQVYYDIKSHNIAFPRTVMMAKSLPSWRSGWFPGPQIAVHAPPDVKSGLPMSTEPQTMARAGRPLPAAYDPVAKTLHWLMALAILMLIGFGLYMTAQPPSLRTYRLFDMHKAVGLSLMVLAVLRLGWRLYRPAPPMLTEGARPWELWLAHIVHVALYALMIAIPVVGWVGASASGLPMTFFGLLPIPALLDPSKPLQEIALSLHGWLNKLFMVVILLHVVGALKRHFITRDATLRRMLPFGSTRT